MPDPAAIDPAQAHEIASHKHDRPLVSCAWDPQGRFVAFGAEDFSLHRLTLEGNAAAAFSGAHDSWVRAVGFSPDGRFAYSGGYDGRLCQWTLAGDPAAALRAIRAHDGWLRALAVSPDGTRLATCGNDRAVRIWPVVDGVVAESPAAVGAGHESHVYEVAWKPDGSALVSCDLKGHLKEWAPDGRPVRDVGRAEALWKYDEGFRADIGGARAIAFRADGAQVAVGGITAVTNAFAGVGHPGVSVLEWADGKLATLLEPAAKQQGVCWGIAWHPKGFWIQAAGGGGGGWLRFFKAGETSEFHAMNLPANGRGMALSPDGTRVAVALADGHLKIFSLVPKPA
ncbi:MAG: WD40 repeat domain-containing protein [Planctomycetaceae bacterium]